MPAIWEEIPFLGPVLGKLADGSEGLVKGGADLAGQGANSLADVLIGKERKERIVTEVPTWLVENISDKSMIINSAKETVEIASAESLRKLVMAFSKRLPEVADDIEPEKLLETTNRFLNNVSHKIHERTNAIREQTAIVFKTALDLICPVLEIINPQPLFESLLQTAKCGINRISQVQTKKTRILLGEVLGDLLELILPALDHLVKTELLLVALLKLSRTVLGVVLAKVGQLSIIEGAISSNNLNVATLGLIGRNGAEFAGFFVDVAEGIKCYASAISLDGRDGQNGPHGQDNELDLSQAMNRHALTCQIQRLAKSLIFILKRMTNPTVISSIDMTAETTLKSDVNASGTVLEVKPSGWQRVVSAASEKWVRLPTSPTSDAKAETLPEGTKPPRDKRPEIQEKWLFVNGVATELFWLHLACKKLAKWFLRDIRGVFNRGDGILWDLIECAGERDATGQGSPTSQKKLIQRTASSTAAQHSLTTQLQAILEQAETQDQQNNSENIPHIVMIAHSQGCLILRLALEQLITADLPGTHKTRETMLEKLCIFTFGNPSVDWNLDLAADFQALDHPRQQFLSRQSLSYLSSHVLRTEHFANKVDFVAKLGVISENRPADSGYAQDCVFVNRERDWIGHLFGTQYSFDKNHYKDEHATDNDPITGDKSWLLACAGGVTVADARRTLRV